MIQDVPIWGQTLARAATGRPRSPATDAVFRLRRLAAEAATEIHGGHFAPAPFAMQVLERDQPALAQPA